MNHREASRKQKGCVCLLDVVVVGHRGQEGVFVEQWSRRPMGV